MRIYEDRDFFDSWNKLVADVARLSSDVQRLWRLTARVVNEPNEVIGGTADDNAGGPGDPAPGVDPELGDDGPPTAPGGPPPGTGYGDAVEDDCCLWMWSGSGWVKLIDRTTDCECPEPDSPGSPFEMRITCCPPPPPCEVPWSMCPDNPLPCVLRVTVQYTGGEFPPLAYCDIYDGTYTLTWNPSLGKWLLGSCVHRSRPFILGDTTYFSFTLSASIDNGPLNVTIHGEVNLTGFVPCDHTYGALAGVDLVPWASGNSCDPLFLRSSNITGSACLWTSLTVTE